MCSAKRRRAAMRLPAKDSTRRQHSTWAANTMRSRCSKTPLAPRISPSTQWLSCLLTTSSPLHHLLVAEHTGGLVRWGYVRHSRQQERKRLGERHPLACHLSAEADLLLTHHLL